MCTAFGLICVAIFQISYTPLLLFGTKTNLEVIGQPGITTTIWTLPETLMIFAVLSFISMKKGILKNIKLIEVLTRNKVVMTATIILLVFNITFLVIMYKLIGVDKIIFNLSFFSQVLIIAMVITFPLLNIYLLILVLYSNYYKERIRILLSKDRLNTLVSILGIYAEEKNFNKIDNIVDDLLKQVHHI